jgi:GGDEF domain-containing protein
LKGSEHLQSDRQIESELLTVLASLRLKLDKREAIFCLLNDEDEAPYEKVLTYFVEDDWPRERAKELWVGLLKYRMELGKVYGQRISLHIAMYHLMRDPEALRDLNLEDGLNASKIVQILAVQELKAWWERCSETGIHLKEVMDQQLERLVYHGLNSNREVSFVLVKVLDAKGELDGEQRSEVGRFLMDACRCRDIVGHYQDNHFALIFPQTPRQGARIAIERLKEFFHKKFNDSGLHLIFAMSNCPENGREGRDLSLVAMDSISEYQKKHKGQVEEDVIIECEGEPRWLYRCWMFHLREPLYSFVSSPLKIAIFLVAMSLSVYAFRQLSWQPERIWITAYEQDFSEEGLFQIWNWGRGEGESFPLERRDGFTSTSGDLVIESGDDVWFQLPIEGQYELQLNFTLKVALQSTFVMSFGPDPITSLAEVRVSQKNIELVDRGVVMEIAPLSFGALEELDLVLEWTQAGVRALINGETYIEEGRWGEMDGFSDKAYFRALDGYALVKDLQLSRRSELDGSRSLGRWESDFIELGDRGPSAWAEKMLKAPARFEAVLRSNLMRRLDMELGAGQSDERPNWLEKWGETVLGGPAIWSDWLRDIEAVTLREHWGQVNMDRSLTLRTLVEASEADEPVSVLKDLVERELWGSSKELFLQTCLVLDWGAFRMDVSAWVWSERFKDLEELSPSEQLSLCLDYLSDELAPEEEHFVLRSCETLLKLGPLRARSIYLAMVANPMVMGLLESWPTKNDDVLLSMIKGKIDMAKGLEPSSLMSLGSWMNNTEIGKVLRFDWMWLCLQHHGMESKDGQYFYKVLTNQSRYPDLARAALAFKGNSTP